MSTKPSDEMVERLMDAAMQAAKKPMYRIPNFRSAQPS